MAQLLAYGVEAALSKTFICTGVQVVQIDREKLASDFGIFAQVVLARCCVFAKNYLREVYERVQE